jgi:hypothetical protein
MKNILYLFLLTLIATSCKKSVPEKSEIQISSIESKGGLGISSYAFKYDNKNRMISLNDTLYFYGSNGKIAWSRFYKENMVNGYKFSDLVRKSYRWDEKLRIKEIHLDSLYQLITGPTGGTFSNEILDIAEAKFFYKGLNNQPDSIEDQFLSNKKPGRVTHFTYDLGNILKKEIRQNQNVFEHSPASKVIQLVDYSYTNLPNYLFDLYNKIGFLPARFGYVASKNAIQQESTKSYFYDKPIVGPESVIQQIVENKYSYTLGINNRISIVNGAGRVDGGLGFGSWAPMLSTYIYY